MADLVHLRAPNGHVIGMTLPLHPAIEKQWRQGELTRVQADGGPWDESTDDPDALGGVAPGPAIEPEGPLRPATGAHKRHWHEYAVAVGACSDEEAGQMTKAALVDLVTPPEEKPAGPEG